MSRAFVNEDATALAGLPVLPDRQISGGRNLVTRRGLGLIEAALSRHREALAAANAALDRDAAAREERELRYWTARQASAELTEPEPGVDTVVFGTEVMVRFDDGQEARYRLVGEDESEPEAGRIAWTAPVGRALMGSNLGDRRILPRGEVEVVGIEA